MDYLKNSSLDFVKGSYESLAMLEDKTRNSFSVQSGKIMQCVILKLMRGVVCCGFVLHIYIRGVAEAFKIWMGNVN